MPRPLAARAIPSPGPVGQAQTFGRRKALVLDPYKRRIRLICHIFGC
jgi:hypothetical protein